MVRPGTKTAAAVDFLAEHPELTPKEVAQQMTEAGISMTASYVSSLKHSKRRDIAAAKRKVKGKTTKANAAPKTAASTRSAAAVFDEHEVLAVAELLDAWEHDAIISTRDVIRTFGSVARFDEVLEVVRKVKGDTSLPI